MKKLTITKLKVVSLRLILIIIVMMTIGGCSNFQKSFTDKESGKNLF